MFMFLECRHSLHVEEKEMWEIEEKQMLSQRSLQEAVGGSRREHGGPAGVAKWLGMVDL